MAAPTFIQEAETAWNSGTTPKGSGNFTTQTSDVVVACSVVEDGATPNVSQTGTNVTLTVQQTVDVADYTEVEVSAGVVAAGGTTSVSFASTVSSHFFGGNALTFRGSDGIGASAKTNVSSGAPSLSITTTQDNSAIVVVVGDWNATDGASRTWRTVNSITPTAGNGYELTYFRDSARYTVYIAYYPDVGAAGSKTVGLSAPSGQKYSIVALEVKGAAASGSTGTMAATNQNDTSSASGTTTVTGTLARTNTNDTMSASGAPTASGSSAATAQNDTMAASGTTTVRGTMAVTNAGDTMAASGAPGDAVAGTMAATNQGDSMSAAGTTTVRGTMAAQAGNDTMGAAGTPSVNGAMAATNQNDTMSASGTSGTPVAGGTRLRPMVGFGQ